MGHIKATGGCYSGVELYSEPPSAAQNKLCKLHKEKCRQSSSSICQPELKTGFTTDFIYMNVEKEFLPCWVVSKQGSEPLI